MHALSSLDVVAWEWINLNYILQDSFIGTGQTIELLKSQGMQTNEHIWICMYIHMHITTTHKQDHQVTENNRQHEQVHNMDGQICSPQAIVSTNHNSPSWKTSALTI